MSRIVQVDPDTGVTVLGYNAYVLDKVQERIYFNLSRIEKVLNMKIDFKSTLNDKELIIHGVDNHSFNKETWFKSKTELVKMDFDCSLFSFSLSQPSKSVLHISFDKYFNIKFIDFNSVQRIGMSYKHMKLIFNKDIILESIDLRSSTFSTDYSKKSKTILSFDEEVTLFKLYQNTNDDVKELLPEYYTPAAYDFNSQDFLDRLKVFSMMVF